LTLKLQLALTLSNLKLGLELFNRLALVLLGAALARRRARRLAAVPRNLLFYHVVSLEVG
jgi:hypothetical protein